MSQPTLEEIYNICSKILEKLDNLETRVSKLESCEMKEGIHIENLIELKEENLELSKEDVLKELKYILTNEKKTSLCTREEARMIAKDIWDEY